MFFWFYINLLIKFRLKILMIIRKNIWLIILIFSLINLMAYPQDTNFFNKLDSSRNTAPILKSIFSDVEEAISNGDVSALSRYFGPQTYFSLSNGINGYYSTNQAFYVFEDFFKIKKVVSFKFNNTQASGRNPYATGIYVFESKGKREIAQVYISLKTAGGGWKITQITIN
ncbi:MAG: hypothetical protein CO127_00435 [Ignavibacteria bacterium CG_4_9_14_3_um_filter_36_18]|nr:MAG: hypothetical protein CO127_00435 [Ignavibacteria bacterium CG_4_9_14_3_um_filter_36_18]